LILTLPYQDKAGLELNALVAKRIT
jgi:hypothetical protein